MKPCETCIHFNMQEDEYCNVEAYVEDGKDCPQYTTSCNPKRLFDILENAWVVANEICEKSKDCNINNCPCFMHDKYNEEECMLETIQHFITCLTRSIKREQDYNREDYTKGM